MLGGLAYVDGDFEPWGLYTNQNAHVAGTLTLPNGAVNGHVLTSNADGDASWQPASEFTLPYFGSTSDPVTPAFHVQNTVGSAISGMSALIEDNYAVRGASGSGTHWGALYYVDPNYSSWGVYTPDNAYVGGTLKLPLGAVDGHVLTSSAEGLAYWDPPSEFTLPYHGSMWSLDPFFVLENTVAGPVARFIGYTGEDIVEIGTDHWTGNALRLGSSMSGARISAGTSTSRGDIVIDATTGDVGIGLTPSAKLHVDGRVLAEDVMLTTGATNGYPLVSDAAGIGSWTQLGPAGLSDPMNFGSQTWDWDFTSGKLDIDITSGYPVLDLTNSSSSGYGNVAFLRSTSTTVDPVGTQVLWVTTQKGRAGTFKKYTADGYSAVDIFSDSTTGLGLYVQGTITSTSYAARGVETSRGTEPVFAVETAEPKIYDSGEAFLSGGRAAVSFDRLFSEAVSKDARIRVTVTPVGGWSALYIESTGPDGFIVRSADGDPDIEFFWTACGLSKDHEAGRQITFPDPDEAQRIASEQAALGFE